MFLVSIIGFLGMPYIMVFSENILDSVLWVKLSKWPPFVQDQAMKSYYFDIIEAVLCFGVYHVVFMYAVHNRIARRYFRHCIVGEKSKMAAICSRSSNEFISFST